MSWGSDPSSLSKQHTFTQYVTNCGPFVIFTSATSDRLTQRPNFAVQQASNDTLEFEWLWCVFRLTRNFLTKKSQGFYAFPKLSFPYPRSDATTKCPDIGVNFTLTTSHGRTRRRWIRRQGYWSAWKALSLRATEKSPRQLGNAILFRSYYMAQSGGQSDGPTRQFLSASVQLLASQVFGNTQSLHGSSPERYELSLGAHSVSN